jgi:hypothetical protein
VTNQGLNWIVAGDINANLLSQSDRSDLFFYALPSGYQSALLAYNHFSYHNKWFNKPNWKRVNS